MEPRNNKRTFPQRVPRAECHPRRSGAAARRRYSPLGTAPGVEAPAGTWCDALVDRPLACGTWLSVPLLFGERGATRGKARSSWASGLWPLPWASMTSLSRDIGELPSRHDRADQGELSTERGGPQPGDGGSAGRSALRSVGRHPGISRLASTARLVSASSRRAARPRAGCTRRLFSTRMLFSVTAPPCTTVGGSRRAKRGTRPGMPFTGHDGQLREVVGQHQRNGSSERRIWCNRERSLIG